MYEKLEFPPLPFGVCGLCKKHDCGVYELDGVKKQQWLQFNLEMDKGGRLAIGYQCIKLMADSMNISVKVVEKQVLLTPSDEQIGDYVRQAVRTYSNMEICGITHRVSSITIPNEDEQSHILHTLDRNGIKKWMTDHDIHFVPQWGEERLREEALKHV